MKVKYLAGASLLGFLVAGCGGQDADTDASYSDAETKAANAASSDAGSETQAQGTDDDPIVAPASMPSTLFDPIERRSDFGEATLTFDASLADVLSEDEIRTLRTDAEAEAMKFLSEAETDAEGAGEYFNPHVLDISFTAGGHGAELASVIERNWSYAGGAHGNGYQHGRIFDVDSRETVRLPDLMTDEAAWDGFVRELRARTIKAKETRYGEAIGDFEIEDWVESSLKPETMRDRTAWLVESTEAGKIGGIAVHFPPYEIGSYAEGSYTIIVPQAVFRSGIDETYRDDFAGDPVEAGD